MARPRLISSPEEFDERADKYFEECENSEKPVTLTGLCIALGLTSRKSIYEYRDRAEFTDSVKSAMMRVENSYECNLHANAAAGSIFALKNFNWKDKQEIDTNMNIRDLTDMSDAELEAIAKRSR
jgi:hypothetical protein